jgi:hypothetical protein
MFFFLLSLSDWWCFVIRTWEHDIVRSTTGLTGPYRKN